MQINSAVDSQTTLLSQVVSEFFLEFSKSWRRESNPLPADYKSAALPSELRQHVAPAMRLRVVSATQNSVKFILLLRASDFVMGGVEFSK